MKQVTLSVYTFDELSKESKKKVLENLRDINIESHGWWIPVYEGVTEDLKKQGYDNVDIEFTGFWSQGDGASFTADVDLEKWLKAAKVYAHYSDLLPKKDEEALAIKITRAHGHYVHSKMMDIELADWVRFETDGSLSKKMDNLLALIKKAAQEEADAIYSKLGQYYQELTSDEFIIDTINANEYEFLENGDFAPFNN